MSLLTSFSKLAGLPFDAIAYRTTSAFTPSTLPKALLSVHRNKPGVWGVIAVDSGALRLARMADPDCKPEARIELINAGDTAVIAPGEPHAVSFVTWGSFTVTFFRESKPPSGEAIAMTSAHVRSARNFRDVFE